LVLEADILPKEELQRNGSEVFVESEKLNSKNSEGKMERATMLELATFQPWESEFSNLHFQYLQIT